MKDRARRAFALILVLAGVALQADAMAAGEPTAADKDRARALLLDGREKLAGGSAQEALKLFQAAHAIMGVPTTGLDVARALEALGRLIEARAMALEVTRIPAVRHEPEAFTKARATAAELAETVEVRIPALVIRVKVPSGGAHVTVDGGKIPAQAIGLPWKVNPGEHMVEAVAAGFSAEQRKVTVKQGQTARVEIALTSEAAPGSDPVTQAILVPDATSQAVSEAAADAKDIPAWAWASGAMGLIGLGVGVAFAIDYANVRSTVAETCPGNVCDPGHYDADGVEDLKARWTRDIGLAVGFGAVGLAGVGMAAYGIMNSSGAKPSDTRDFRQTSIAVLPWVGSGAGAVVRGAFR